MKTMKTTVKQLTSIYDACKGVLSEYDAFALFYNGGGAKLLKDFGSALEALGVKFVEPTYTAVQYEQTDPRTGKKTGNFAWGVCTDPHNPDESWVLTGLSSKIEAEDLVEELLSEPGE